MIVRLVLAGLYDPTDEDRGNSAFEKFKEIKTLEVRRATAAKIANLLVANSRGEILTTREDCRPQDFQTAQT